MGKYHNRYCQCLNSHTDAHTYTQTDTHTGKHTHRGQDAVLETEKSLYFPLVNRAFCQPHSVYWIYLPLIGGLKASQVELVVKNSPATAGDKRPGFDSWVGKIPWMKAWQTTPVFLPGESHGQRSLAVYGP